MKYEELDQAFDPKPTDKKSVCVCNFCGAVYSEYVNGCPRCEQGHVYCRAVTKQEFEELQAKDKSTKHS